MSLEFTSPLFSPHLPFFFSLSFYLVQQWITTAHSLGIFPLLTNMSKIPHLCLLAVTLFL